MNGPRIRRGGRLGPLDATQVPRFGGPPTFARLPAEHELDGAPIDVGILGAPFDSGVSYRPGARFGPGAVRDASRLLRPYNPAQDVEPFAAQQVADLGDLALNPFMIDDAVATIEREADRASERAGRLLTIGGDHTIALPLLRSVSRRFGGPVAVVHFDAHLDTWDSYFGAPTTHGTPFRRASEEGLLDVEACVHVGIRGPLYSTADLTDDAVLGFQVITSDDLDGGTATVAERIRARVGDRPVYVSVDIDVLDPAFAPGTGTPEAGGMTSRELLGVIRRLRGLDLVGADVVEVAPAYDHAQITGVAASHVLYELLSAMAPPADTPA